MRVGWMVSAFSVASTAFAAPPAAPIEAAEPVIEMHVVGDQLAYTYDLTPVFDEAMWKVLSENGFSEILIQVNLVDSAEKLRLTQHHQLKVELLDKGQIRLTTGPKQETIYPSRATMLKALRAVRGQPIPAAKFASNDGYLDMLVLVNPVRIFDYPEGGAEGVAVGERVVYDRKIEARSAAAFAPR